MLPFPLGNDKNIAVAFTARHLRSPRPPIQRALMPLDLSPPTPPSSLGFDPRSDTRSHWSSWAMTRGHARTHS